MKCLRPLLANSLLLASILQAANALASDYQPSLSDFGGAGLLQTPTARMFAEGEAGLIFSQVTPYRRGSLTFQPVDWLEANVRYTNVSNRDYDSTGTISDQSYIDKGIDFKLGLLDEHFYTPQLALGFRDIGGTGLFASEYIVASKRFADVDITIGMAWGYMGSRGDMNNPLSLLFGNGFDERPGRKKNDQGGNVNFNSFFRGAPSLFGGVEYHTPWQPLSLKFEYDGNNYRYEPQRNNQKQDSPVNIGAVFRINDIVNIHAGVERGNTAMLGLTLHTNLANTPPQIKLSDPEPEPVSRKESHDNTETDWKSVSRRLKKNAGYSVSEIAMRNREVVIRGEQEKYFTHAQGIGRASRIMHNSVKPDVEWITVIDETKGFAVKETSISREQLLQVANNDADIQSLRNTLSESPATSRDETVVYENDEIDWFSYGAGLGYKQSMGGPDKFILYQFTADAGAEVYFQPGLWWSGGISIALLDNYDEFKYDGPSRLPRVRTDIRQYLTTSNVMIPTFQLSYAQQLNGDFFSVFYAGMLETMYGGIGGEMMYRPLGERLALGIDLNWVKQRAYEQDFNFRHYETVTGHLTGYWDTGFSGMLVALSAGRYLAKDWGLTLDISRTFKNGVSMGGYATRTNVSKEEFGEGSFDKGIYISIPFDLMLTSSTLRKASFRWSPLTRDGGAKLSRQDSLYQMTKDRDLDRFHDGFEHFTD